MDKIQAARKAIEKAGGQTALANKLSVKLQKPITQWRVQKWSYAGVPPEFVLHVHELTTVPLYHLDPDLYPKRLFKSTELNSHPQEG